MTRRLSRWSINGRSIPHSRANTAQLLFFSSAATQRSATLGDGEGVLFLAADILTSGQVDLWWLFVRPSVHRGYWRTAGRTNNKIQKRFRTECGRGFWNLSHPPPQPPKPQSPSLITCSFQRGVKRTSRFRAHIRLNRPVSFPVDVRDQKCNRFGQKLYGLVGRPCLRVYTYALCSARGPYWFLPQKPSAPETGIYFEFFKNGRPDSAHALGRLYAFGVSLRYFRDGDIFLLIDRRTENAFNGFFFSSRCT